MNSPSPSPLDDVIETLRILEADNADTASWATAYKDLCAKYNAPVWSSLQNLIDANQASLVDRIIPALLKAAPTDYEGWKTALLYFRTQNGFATGRQLFMDLLEQSRKDHVVPDDLIYETFRYLGCAYAYIGDRDKVREILKSGYERCGRPIDFQFDTSALTIPEDVSQSIRNELQQDFITSDRLRPDPVNAQDTIPTDAKTTQAQEIGSKAAVLSGVIAHTQPGGEYAFEYGNHPDDLAHRTDWEPVPPASFAEVSDMVLANLPQWPCYRSGYAINNAPCAITLKSPFATDRNHLTGTGQITLLYGWHASALPQGERRTASRMHAMDLRGGRVSFHARHHALDAHGGRFVLGTTSYEPDRPENDWRSSAWMMTGRSKPCTGLPDGDWMELTFDISADPALWSFGANNPDEQPDAERYIYRPPSSMIGAHNGNLVLYQMFAPDHEIAEGEITLSHGHVAYRDWSMLRPENGAALVAFPGDDEALARNLTNGLYRGPGDGWDSVEAQCTGPYKFVWSLPEHERIDGITFTQNARYPLLMAQVYLRDGGPDGRIVHAGLVSFPAFDINTPPRVFTDVPDGVQATHLELNLMQGQNPEGVGLLGIEVFGDFAPQLPVQEPLDVCHDVSGLKPGTDTFYRLVYRDANGILEGETRSLRLPNDTAPLVFSLTPMVDQDGAWMVQVNPMGKDTALEIRLDGEIIEERPLGRGQCRRHMAFQLEPDQLAGAKTLSVVARNATGASDPLSMDLN